MDGLKWQSWQLSFSTLFFLSIWLTPGLRRGLLGQKNHYNRSVPFLPDPPLLFSIAPFVYAGVTLRQQVVNIVCQRL